MTEIADVLYGRIKLNDIEECIISHQYFQRLRRTKHLGFLNLIFPSANHTRFEHSLGVMHLAQDFLEAILNNTDLIANRYDTEDAFPELKKRCKYAKGHLKKLNNKKARAKLICVVRLCALLHDIGHGPFSHAFEYATPTWKQIKKDNISSLKQLQPPEAKDDARIKHEQYSVAIVDHLLKDPLIYNCLNKQLRNKEMFYNFYKYVISSGEFSDFDLARLCEVEKLPEGTAAILKSILSGIIDVDRMDFLYRDSHHAGVKYGIFDIERLKSSLVIWSETTNRIRLAIRSGGLSSLEHYLFCLYQMYLQIYLHKTENAANAMLIYIQTELEKSDGWKQFRKDYLYNLRKYCELDDAAYVEHLKKLCAQNSRLKDVFEALFYKRQLWERQLEVNPTKDVIPFESIKIALKKRQIVFQDYECGRELLKGLSFGKKEGDALAVLTREYKIGDPLLSNLRETSELCMLFGGRKYNIFRCYAPEIEGPKIKKYLTKNFFRRKKIKNKS